jgi:transcriptional regulator with PAS, ATPase and Fis domain
MDLYYRLGVGKLFIPPLRQRKEDILPLARHFLSKLRLRYKRPAIVLSPEAEQYFLLYSWPGNVRELQNLLEGIVSTDSSPMITPDQVYAYLDQEKNNGYFAGQESAACPLIRGELPKKNKFTDEVKKRKLKFRPSLADKDRIIAALNTNNYNCTRTAKELGISRRTLYRRMEQYNLLN